MKDKKSTRCKRCRMVGRIFAVLVLLGMVTAVMVGYRYHKRTEAALTYELQQIREAGRGETWQDLIPPAIPAEENLAVFYQRAFDHLTADGKPFTAMSDESQIDEDLAGEVEQLFNVSADYRDATWMSERDTLLAEPRVRAALAEVVKGRGLLHAQWEVDLAQGIIAPLPHLLFERLVSRLQILEAQRLQEAGNVQGATALFTDIFVYGMSRSQEASTFIEMLVGISITTMPTSALFNFPQLPLSDGERLRATLSRRNLHKSLVNTLEIERCLGDITIQEVINGDSGNLAWKLALYSANRALYLRVMREYFEQLSSNAWRVTSVDIDAYNFERMMAGLLEPAVDSIANKAARLEGLCRQLELALQLEATWSPESGYDFANIAEPMDPSTDLAITLNREGKGFTLTRNPADGEAIIWRSWHGRSDDQVDGDKPSAE